MTQKSKTSLVLLLLISTVFICPANNKIDRKAVVDRHLIVTTENIANSPAQVGNGEFAFGVDITGLQTFLPHYTMSQRSWHTFPKPDWLKLEEFRGVTLDTHGRGVQYDIYSPEQPEHSDWLARNPHRFNMGRIRLILTKSDGSLAKLEDLTNTTQQTDMWRGIITSRFELEGVPVEVQTSCHADRDAVGVVVKSELIKLGRLTIGFSFPYPSMSGTSEGIYDKPDAHTTTLSTNDKNRAVFERVLDNDKYNVCVGWSPKAALSQDTPHFYTLAPAKTAEFRFSCEFTEGKVPATTLTAVECTKSSEKMWKEYWMSGAAIDLSESKDARWKELERRVVLSQYIMRVNEAGSLPPQESGLVNNSGWFGRLHLEMVWWHDVHYALWDRWPLFDKCLGVYNEFLPTSTQRASKQGYKGARWPKCTGDIDRDWPDNYNHGILIWQQPHPIYFAELDYRLHPTAQTLEKWKDVVFGTADFMADYAFYDKKKGEYILGPPIAIVSENNDRLKASNPTFELGYWRYGIRVAQTWRERMSMDRNPDWDEVLNKLSPLPVEDGVYVTHEDIDDMWGKYTWEHPALIGVLGMLPGDGVDYDTFDRTLNKVFSCWNFSRTWGWDFPMLAMAAARTGKCEKAIDMLLHESHTFHFDQHGLATGGPFPYFPSNGALLTAVAMMAGGWDGSTEDAPGFPKNGQWVVKHEGFNKMQ